MKRAIIFYNGDLTNLEEAKKYIRPTDVIICADGGVAHAFKLGLKPHVVIGDFDSSSKSLQKKLKDQKIETIRYKTNKDETDSELAINYAIKKGYKTMLLFGIFGSRLDHMLTNIFALDYLLKKNIDITIIEGKKEIKMINDTIVLQGKKGDLVSLIPIHGDVKQVTTKNLQYKLVNEDLAFGYSRGISNVFTDNTVTIFIKKGTLLVIHEKQ